MPSLPSVLTGLRLGSGYALSELGAPRPLRLAGEDFDGLPGVEGDEQDDGDCVSRAVVEALLAAAGLPGVASVFPEEHPDRYFADSLDLLRRACLLLTRSRIAGLLQCNVQLFHAQPSLLQAGVGRMRANLAAALDLPPAQVGLSIDRLPGQLAQPAPGECAALASVLCVLAEPAGVREPLQPGQPRSMSELKSILRELEAAEAPPSRAPAQDEPVRAYVHAGADSGWRGTKGTVDEEEFLPERAKKFERSLATKLHPLPAAPPPKAGDRLIVYTDGASRGNPGAAASGYCIMNELGQVVHEGGSRLGSMTNNQAEYSALIEAVDWIGKELGCQFKLELRLDSQLVQRQLNGEYRIKDEELKELALYAMNKLMNFYEFKLVHIPRAENARADALANLALDGPG